MVDPLVPIFMITLLGRFPIKWNPVDRRKRPRASGEKVESPVFRKSDATNQKPDLRAIQIYRPKVWAPIALAGGRRFAA
jgi:hypothetical protein